MYWSLSYFSVAYSVIRVCDNNADFETSMTTTSFPGLRDCRQPNINNHQRMGSSISILTQKWITALPLVLFAQQKYATHGKTFASLILRTRNCYFCQFRGFIFHLSVITTLLLNGWEKRLSAEHLTCGIFGHFFAAWSF